MFPPPLSFRHLACQMTPGDAGIIKVSYTGFTIVQVPLAAAELTVGSLKEWFDRVLQSQTVGITIIRQV